MLGNAIHGSRLTMNHHTVPKVDAQNRGRAMDRLSLLKQLSFGSQVAEEEIAHLESYFVHTEQWNKIFTGGVDVVRGEKGAGKSALYLLLGKNENVLFDRGIITVSAENVRGATVFRDLVSDPPTSEPEFILLWKVYILAIICHQIRDLGVDHGEIRSVFAALEDAQLLEPKLNLAALLRGAQNLARRLLRGSSLEGGLQFDPSTGAPVGVSGKISLAEPSAELRNMGVASLDGMFAKVNAGLRIDGYQVWVLLDRLDVAFSDSHELEANAIRALIRVYSDLRGYEKVSLKIFLREDIWKRITQGGMREASHITRFEIMRWTSPMLLNLTLRRILSNDVLVKEFGIDREAVLKDVSMQDALFARLFPAQVEQGPQKATTFNWMVGRCADATGNTAPRELIHLLNCIRDEEIKRLERGSPAAPGDQLFDRSVFKSALPTVSATRLNTYLYAEYPTERPFLERLEGQKAEQTAESLMGIWGLSREEALSKASDLAALGFFEARGTRAEPTFWVPFLYRDALHLVQGKADSETG